MRRLLLLLAVCGNVGLQSQPPTPTPTKTSQKQQQDSGDETTKGVGPQSSNPTVTTLIESKSQAKKTDNYQKSAPDWWITAFTGALVVLAIFQFWAMHRQAEYMRRGLRISIKQTRLAMRSASAAKVSADAAKASVEAARDQMTLLERQTKATEETAKAAMVSADTAKRSLEILRAEVSVETVKISEYDVPAITTNTVIYIVLANYGRTPAQKVRVGVLCRIADEVVRPFVEPTIPFSISSNGGTKDVSLGQTGAWLKAHYFAKIESAEFIPFLEITVEYEDGFGQGQWIETCGHFHPRSGWQPRKHSLGELPYK